MFLLFGGNTIRNNDWLQYLFKVLSLLLTFVVGLVVWIGITEIKRVEVLESNVNAHEKTMFHPGTDIRMVDMQKQLDRIERKIDMHMTKGVTND